MNLTDGDTVKMALFQSDLAPENQDWDAWRSLLRQVVGADPGGLACADFERSYRMLEANPRELFGKLLDDQMDNYILGSLAAYRMGVPRHVPLVAWAAENKRLYPGWHGEIANLRTLLILGYDADVPDPQDGNTALHKMCNLKWGPGVHVRAVTALLESGASPNIANNSGDTAFGYLCGSHPYTEDVSSALLMMIQAGADPRIKAADGSDAMDVLRLTQKVQPDSARLALIEHIEMAEAAGQAPASRARKATL